MPNMQRRPIKQRTSAWAQAITQWLVQNGLTPNQISVAGLVAAAIGALTIGGTAWFDPSWRPIAFIFGALMIEARLLANMFDGMVAVEGGKGTALGDLFNELPDRFADIFFLISVGIATQTLFGGVLGVAAALLAVLTAYVRAVGSALGAPADFSGPMAKPHRMQSLVATLILAAMATPPGFHQWVLMLGLAVISLGTAWTVWRRLARLAQFLNAQAP